MDEVKEQELLGSINCEVFGHFLRKKFSEKVGHSVSDDGVKGSQGGLEEKELQCYWSILHKDYQSLF